MNNLYLFHSLDKQLRSSYNILTFTKEQMYDLYEAQKEHHANITKLPFWQIEFQFNLAKGWSVKIMLRSSLVGNNQDLLGILIHHHLDGKLCSKKLAPFKVDRLSWKKFTYLVELRSCWLVVLIIPRDCGPLFSSTISLKFSRDWNNLSSADLQKKTIGSDAESLQGIAKVFLQVMRWWNGWQMCVAAIFRSIIFRSRP